MTDFGADHAFGQVPKKLHEHYGIEMPVSTIRKITEFHGEHMHQQRETMTLSGVIHTASKGCVELGCHITVLVNQG